MNESNKGLYILVYEQSKWEYYVNDLLESIDEYASDQCVILAF